MTRDGGGARVGTFDLRGAVSDGGTASMPAGWDGCSPYPDIDLSGAIGSVVLSLGGPVECVGTTKGGKGYTQRDLVFGIYPFHDASGGHAAIDSGQARPRASSSRVVRTTRPASAWIGP